LRDDVLKCQTRPLTDAEFAADLDPAQLDAMQRVFPEGVCDWTKPSVGQVPMSGTWLSFDGS
jgi:hypothetical protein